jgi:hypothetical protein
VTTPDQPALPEPAHPEPPPPQPPLSPPPTAEVAARQAPPPSLAPLVVIVLLLLIAAGGAAYLLLKPRLAFTNRLAAPVRVGLGGGPPVTVPPGGTSRLSGPFGRTIVAEWELVRPLSADSAAMGEIIRGSTVATSPRGTVHAEAGTRSGEAAYFAPLITNATTQPLRVLVNAGLQGAMDCECAVRPGAERVFIGYYRLYQNSTVQVRGSGGGTAAFTDLGPKVVSVDGTVGLRFEDKDLRGGRPPAP